MIADSVRLTEIIMVQKGADLDFFTKQGVYIGSIGEGTVVNRKPESPKVEKPKAGVVKSLTPDQVKLEEAKHNEEVISSAGVAQGAVEKNLIAWQKGN